MEHHRHRRSRDGRRGAGRRGRPFRGVHGGPLQPPRPDDARRRAHGSVVPVHRCRAHGLGAGGRLCGRTGDRAEHDRGRRPTRHRGQLVPPHARPRHRARRHSPPGGNVRAGPRRAAHHRHGVGLAWRVGHLRHRRHRPAGAAERAGHPADAGRDGPAARRRSRGGRRSGGGDSGERAEAEQSWTFREAVRTPAFTLIILSIILNNYGGGGLPFHMPQIYADQGLRRR